MYSMSETMCVDRRTILSFFREEIRFRNFTLSLGSSLQSVHPGSKASDGSKELGNPEALFHAA